MSAPIKSSYFTLTEEAEVIRIEGSQEARVWMEVFNAKEGIDKKT